MRNSTNWLGNKFVDMQIIILLSLIYIAIIVVLHITCQPDNHYFVNKATTAVATDLIIK